MTTEVAEKAVRAKETESEARERLTNAFDPLDRLFRIAPIKYRAKDGSGKVLIVEHRLGRAAGFFTDVQLLKRTGLEKEYSDMLRKLQRKITNSQEFESLSESLWATQKRKLSNMMRGFKKMMASFYASQDATPCMTYVPVDDQGTMGFYIQALVDSSSYSLLAGEPEDAGLWNEVTAVREQSHVNLYDRAIKAAKQLMRLPSVNKDIQHRMKLLCSGDIPGSVKLLGGPSK